MNPTGDKLTAELQKTVNIEKPAAEGAAVGTSTDSHTTTGKTLEEGVDVVGSGFKYTGDKIGAGIDTVGSGVQYTGEKIGEGIKYTGEKLGEGVHTVGSGVRATGQMIGDTIESVAPTIAAGGDKIENVVQKGVDVIEEQKAKTELPGVITLIQSGTARLAELVMGTAGPNPDPFVEEEKLKEKVPEIAPQTVSMTDKVPIDTIPQIVVTEDRAPETVVHAQTTIVGDTFTTSIETVESGHWTEQNKTRFDIVKNELGPSVPQKDQLGSGLSRDIKGGGTDVVHIHEQPTQEMQQQQLLPNLTKKDVHDATVFLDKAEDQSFGTVPLKETHQSHERLEQFPNLTQKDVHDAAVFIDQAENQTVNVSQDNLHKDQQKIVPDNVSQSTEGGKSDLPSLTSENVHIGTTFLDTTENPQ